MRLVKWPKIKKCQNLIFKVDFNIKNPSNLSKKKFLERFEAFMTLKIDFENQILALFDVYFWPFNKSHEKINTIFLISAIIASI